VSPSGILIIFDSNEMIFRIAIVNLWPCPANGVICHRENVLVLAIIWIPNPAMATWLFSVLLVLNQELTYLPIPQMIHSKQQSFFYCLYHPRYIAICADGCIAEVLLWMETSPLSTWKWGSLHKMSFLMMGVVMLLSPDHIRSICKTPQRALRQVSSHVAGIPLLTIPDD
jgi:hypothetical protein